MLHGFRSSAGQRLSSVGLAAGILLLALSGLLPERLQLAFAYCGIALALLSAAFLVSLMTHRSLQWKGVSPALGIVLGVLVGAMPGILSSAWHRTGDYPVARPAAVRTAARRPANDVHTVVAMRVVPPDSVAVAAVLPAKPLGAVLNELSYILDQKARPALDSLHGLLTSVADAPESTDVVSLRSQLEPGVNDLAEVAASLERIEAENPNLTPELREAIGGGRALGTLNSGLHQLSLAEGDARGYGASRLRRLANATESAVKWVDNVDGQLAQARR